MVTEFGQVVEGFDQVFDSGQVVVVIPGKTPVLVHLSEDGAWEIGKTLLRASRAARRVKKREAAEGSLTDEENDE